MTSGDIAARHDLRSGSQSVKRKEILAST